MIFRFILVALLGLPGAVHAQENAKRPAITTYLNRQCQLVTEKVSAQRLNEAQRGENNGGCVTFIEKDGHELYVRESALEPAAAIVCDATPSPSKVRGGGQAAGAGGRARCPR